MILCLGYIKHIGLSHVEKSNVLRGENGEMSSFSCSKCTFMIIYVLLLASFTSCCWLNCHWKNMSALVSLPVFAAEIKFSREFTIVLGELGQILLTPNLTWQICSSTGKITKFWVVSLFSNQKKMQGRPCWALVTLLLWFSQGGLRGPCGPQPPWARWRGSWCSSGRWLCWCQTR